MRESDSGPRRAKTGPQPGFFGLLQAAGVTLFVTCVATATWKPLTAWWALHLLQSSSEAALGVVALSALTIASFAFLGVMAAILVRQVAMSPAPETGA